MTVNELKSVLLSKCLTFDQWSNTFDEFIGHAPRSNTALNEYKNSPDFCTWEMYDEYILTISYQYVHCLSLNGDMFCLQEYTQDKNSSIENYKKLPLSKNLPVLEDFQIIDKFLYTKFSSPTKNLGYPAPYMILNIMYHSENVIEDFREYIKRIIDNFISLNKSSILCNLPLYKPKRLLTNHYVDECLYFKDSVFFGENNITIEQLADDMCSNIDGFKRAKGIISAYQSRQDSEDNIVKQLYQEIDNLQQYVREECQNLKNVNL